MPPRSHDIFVSHSTSDVSVAQIVCEALEGAGMGCWIAPRDILPGQTWSGAIVEGIAGCRVVLILLSARSGASTEVLREVELASRHRRKLVAVRIDDVAPSGDLAYFLSATQWFDAFPPPLPPRLAELVDVVRAHLGIEERTLPGESTQEPELVEVDLDDFGRRGRRRAGIIDRLLGDR
jgi:hypothetical protein